MTKHHSGSYYVNKAKSAGLEVRNGSGDHVIIRGNSGRGYMAVPMHRELSNGTENAIRKWFVSLGIVVGLGFCAYVSIATMVAYAMSR